MTHTKKIVYTFSNSNPVSGDLDTYAKVLSWAHLNFRLQSYLHKTRGITSENINMELEEVGYIGTCIKELSDKDFEYLFEKESFFSSSQTGKRIVSFALRENGLKQDRFQEIENSITDAYKKVKTIDDEDTLLAQSYQHCIDTLYVFKL